jgi:hypothetical protein
LSKSERLISFTYICFLGAVLVGYLFFSGRLVAEGSLLFGAEGQSVHFSDFLFFYREARIVSSDDRTKIYDPEVQLKVFNQLIKPFVVNQDPIDQHAPLTFCLMGPLALIPVIPAYIVWCLISLLGGFASLYLVSKAFDRFQGSKFILFMLGVCGSFPAWWALHVGQMSWIVLTIACLCIWAWQRRRDYLLGLSLAFLIVKPHYGLFFAVPLLALRRWKSLSATVVSEAVLMGGCMLIVGIENVVNYPTIVYKLDMAQDLYGVHPLSMVSIRSLLSLFFPQPTALTLNTIFMLSGLGVMFWFWRNTSKNPDLLVPWAFALSVVYSLTLSPHTHPYDLALLSIPALLTLPSLNIFECARGQGGPGSARAMPSYRIWCLVLLFYPIISFCAFLYWNIGLQNAMDQPSPLFYVNLALLISGSGYFLSELKNQKGAASKLVDPGCS